MYGWTTGWPEYIQEPKSDYPAITSIAEKAAKIAGVSMDEEEGYMRIKNGLASIAAFCRNSITWQTKNIHYINNGLQAVLLEMSAYKRAKEKDIDKLKENERVLNAQSLKRKQEEKEMRESSKRSLIETIEDWDYIWEHSYRVYKESKSSICLTREQSEKDLEKRGEEFTEAIKKDVEKKRKENIKKLKNWID